MTDEQWAALMIKLDDLHGDFREYKGKSEAEIKSITKTQDNAGMWENIKVVGSMVSMALGHHFFGGGK